MRGSIMDLNKCDTRTKQCTVAVAVSTCVLYNYRSVYDSIVPVYNFPPWFAHCVSRRNQLENAVVLRATAQRCCTRTDMYK